MTPTSTLERPTPPPLRAVATKGGPAAGGRDLFLDALRMLVIVLVVLQHWSLPVLAYSADSSTLALDTVLSTDGGYLLTWFVQVMPLIFFVGGAVNIASLRSAAAKGTRTSEWVARRLRRIAWPVIPLAAAWIPGSYLLTLAGVPEQPLGIGAEAAGMVLWFLAVYVLVVVATPVLSAVEDRFGWWAAGGLFAGAVLVDLLRFGTGIEEIGYANVVFVWLGIHQLGFRYAAGAIGRRTAAVMAVAGIAAAIAIAGFGPHSSNMTGVFAEEASNVAPPSMVLAALGVGEVGIAMLLRPWISAWTMRAGPAKLLDWAGPRLMTVYLWHMVPLVLITGVLVLGLGVSTPDPLTVAWVVWCGLGAALLFPLVLPVVRWALRFEQPPRSLRGDPGVVRMLLSAALTGAGLLVLTVGGLGTGALPLLGVLAIGAGLMATLPATRRPRPHVPVPAPVPAA